MDQECQVDPRMVPGIRGRLRQAVELGPHGRGRDVHAKTAEENARLRYLPTSQTFRGLKKKPAQSYE